MVIQAQGLKFDTYDVTRVMIREYIPTVLAGSEKKGEVLKLQEVDHGVFK